MVDFIKVSFDEQKLEKQNKGVYVIKNKTLLAPGKWNGKLYSSDEIKKSFFNTNWEDKDVVSLIADHNDDDRKGRPLTIRDWLGFVSNQHTNDEGFLIGDLNICDKDLAFKLENGAPFGISPFLGGMDDNGNMRDFFYKNFAVVVEPACKESFINLSDDELSVKLEDLSVSERIIKKTGMSMDEIERLNETNTNNISGSKINSNGLQPIKTKKELDSIELKGGNKMAENEKQVTENLEVEQVEVELSEDQLLEEIAKLAEKYLAKKKVTPEESKMKEMEKEIVSLKNELKKLSEVKEKEVENTKLSEEKLRAKSRTIAKTIPNENNFTFGGNKSLVGSTEFAAMLK